MILGEGERLEDLQCNGLKIIQSKNLYTFTSDSIILANFVKTKVNDIAVEIGAGCGVISILMQEKNKVKKIYAFELQKQMQDLCEKNIELNNLTDKIILCKDDVKNFDKFLMTGSVDVVFSNPPYFKETDFKQSQVKKIAKEEVCLPLESLVNVANKMLKFGGNFYCCYCSERACELVASLQKNGFAVKEMFFTENGKGDVKLVVLRAVKGGKNGCKIYPNLVTNEEDGGYLEKLQTKNFLNNQTN